MNARRLSIEQGRRLGREILLAAALQLLPAGAAWSAFEDLGAGARPIGMASAFTAVSDDANAIHYNPAGLAQLRYPQLTMGYGRLFINLTDETDLGSGSLAFALPLEKGRGTLAAGVLNLQLAGSYREDTFSLSYGRSVSSSVLAGVNLNFLRRSYGSDAYTDIDPVFQQNGLSADAASLDLGVLYRPSNHYVFGLTGKHLNKPDVGLSQEDRVPAAWKGAFAYYQRAFVMAAELTRKEKDTTLSVGGERWLFRHKVAARGGFDFGSGQRRNVALGATARVSNAQLDYAFILPLSGLVDTAGSHRISFTLRFGSQEKGPLAILEQEDILGIPLYSKEDVAKMREELQQAREEAEAYQKQTEAIQARVAELEAQIRVLRGGAPARLSVPSQAEPPQKIAVPSESSDLKKMEQELQRLRDELQKRNRERTAPATPKPTGLGFERPGLYTVQPGDTLKSIAAKTMGDADRWIEIFKANEDRIKRGGELTPGQIIIIP